jgi:hypothetical protein
MATCNDLIAGLSPDCDALNKVGGVNKRVYIGLKNNITTSVDTAGYVNSISMATVGSLASKLYKFTGKRDKNSAMWPITAGENVNTFKHTAVLELFYSNPTQLLSIQSLINSDDCVVFMQQNDGKIICLGLEIGLNASAAEGGTGTLLNDTTGYKITLSGEQTIMPQYFSINGANATLAQNLAYLDNLSSAL